MASSQAAAGTLGVRWDPAPGATGYRVSYGTDPGRLEQFVDVAGAREAVLHGLTDCTTWYASVTAYNADGESAPSPAVSSWPRPTIAILAPERLMQGAQVELTLGGSNLGPDTRAEIDSAGLALRVEHGSCGELRVAAAAEPTAPGRRPAHVGTFDLRVASPEGLTASHPFEVRIDPLRFDVGRAAPSTDGRIDGVDVVHVARRFAGREGDAIYDPDLDFDGDGWIDGTELSWLGASFGHCWDGSMWTATACPPWPEDSP